MMSIPTLSSVKKAQNCERGSSGNTRIRVKPKQKNKKQKKRKCELFMALNKEGDNNFLLEKVENLVVEREKKQVLNQLLSLLCKREEYSFEASGWTGHLRRLRMESPWNCRL